MLFPLPETPVIAIKLPNGISILIFFKLFPDAPFKISFLLFPLRLLEGIFIAFFPERYFPVIDFFDFKISFGVPENVISPPFLPAPGPISIT